MSVEAELEAATEVFQARCGECWNELGPEHCKTCFRRFERLYDATESALAASRAAAARTEQANGRLRTVLESLVVVPWGEDLMGHRCGLCEQDVELSSPHSHSLNCPLALAPAAVAQEASGGPKKAV